MKFLMTTLFVNIFFLFFLNRVVMTGKTIFTVKNIGPKPEIFNLVTKTTYFLERLREMREFKVPIPKNRTILNA